MGGGVFENTDGYSKKKITKNDNDKKDMITLK